MIVDHTPPPSLPLTAATSEKSISDSASPKIARQFNEEKIKPSDDGGGVDLIGDATSWPSLSESTRPSPKSSPAPMTTSSISASQAPAIPNSPQNHRLPNTNPTPNPNPSFSPNPNRPRFSGRGGSSRGGGPSRGGFTRHPPPPQQLPSPPPLPPVLYTGFESPMGRPFFHGNGYNNNNFPQPRSPYRGGGRHFNNNNNNNNRGRYQGPDWAAAPPLQGFHPRERVSYSMPQPMGYQMPPQQLVPFQFMHVLPPEPFMGMPPYAGGHGPVPPPSLSPPPPPPVELETKLVNQINYYFSDENLIKDMYLRSQMDDSGWVSVSLIANFNKVRKLTQDIHFILESLGASAIVEVQGDKIRRRNDWRRWIPTGPQPTTGLNTIGVVAV